MKVLLIITAFFTLTGVISVTITDASCSQKKSETNEIKYEVNGKLKNKGDKITITILNYQELENVMAESDDPNILNVEGPDENGIITVTALVDNNSANVIITATDAQKVEIPLSISDKTYILLALDNAFLWQGESTTLRITNIDELKDPVITNETSDHIEITEIDYVKGTATVTALNIAGSAKISVNASNAWLSEDIYVAIKFNKTIQTNDLPQSINVGESVTLTILNIDEFVGFNLQIFSDPTGFVEIGEIDEQGNVSITGIKVGTPTIKMTADHTDPWSNQLTVKINPR